MIENFIERINETNVLLMDIRKLSSINRRFSLASMSNRNEINQEIIEKVNRYNSLKFWIENRIDLVSSLNSHNEIIISGVIE